MIIVRYGEIGLKSPQTRSVMEKTLVRNIRAAIGDKVVRREHGRIFVESDSREVAQSIAMVFGVVSTSVAHKTSSRLDTVVDVGSDFAKERLDAAKTFAVRARRKGTHSYKSLDIAKKLGSEIVCETGARVDLDNPDVTIYVEVRDRDAYIFDKIIRGFGGMPMGTQGKVIALISGGIDSPVAAWLMMKRGVEIIPVFMDCRPLVDDRTIERAKESIKVLSKWANTSLKTYIVPYGNALLEFLKYGDHKLGCVLCKRMMYRVAFNIAVDEKAKALVSGDSLGQVASQTLDNIAAISRGINLPILRPLISMDKTEIVELAKRIGSYEISIQPANCCLGPPEHPETKASFKKLSSAEEELDMDSLINEALDKLEVVDVTYDQN